VQRAGRRPRHCRHSAHRVPRRRRLVGGRTCSSAARDYTCGYGGAGAGGSTDIERSSHPTFNVAHGVSWVASEWPPSERRIHGQNGVSARSLRASADFDPSRAHSRTAISQLRLFHGPHVRIVHKPLPWSTFSLDVGSAPRCPCHRDTQFYRKWSSRRPVVIIDTVDREHVPSNPRASVSRLMQERPVALLAPARIYSRSLGAPHDVDPAATLSSRASFLWRVLAFPWNLKPTRGQQDAQRRLQQRVLRLRARGVELPLTRVFSCCRPLPDTAPGVRPALRRDFARYRRRPPAR